MKSFVGKVIAITGAGSGLGRAMAMQLAEQGAQLSLSDLNAQGLEETKALCNMAAGARISATTIDVRDESQLALWAEQTQAEFGVIDALINNAGVSLNACVDDTSIDNYRWVMDINFWGMLIGTKIFLPFIRQSNHGHIVFISSVYGMMGGVDQSAYASSKFAIRGFAESLRQELQLTDPNITITCAHPAGLKTNFMENARFGQRVGYTKSDEQLKKDFSESLAVTSPEQAAKAILAGMLKEKSRLLVGRDAKFFFDPLIRLFPTRYGSIVSWVVHRLTRSNAKMSVSN